MQQAITLVEELGGWAAGTKWEDLSEAARSALKARVLDSVGCAVGALGGAPVQAIRRLTADLGESSGVTLIGGGRSAPDRAALLGQM